MTFSAFSFFNCSFLFQLRNGESVACLVLSSPDDRHEPLFDRLVQLFVFFCGSRLVLDLFPPKSYKTPQNCLDLTVKRLWCIVGNFREIRKFRIIDKIRGIKTL